MSFLNQSLAKRTLVSRVLIPLNQRSWNERPWKYLIWSQKNIRLLVVLCMPNFQTKDQQTSESYFRQFVSIVFQTNQNRSSSRTFESCSFRQAWAVRNEDSRYEIGLNEDASSRKLNLCTDLHRVTKWTCMFTCKCRQVVKKAILMLLHMVQLNYKTCINLRWVTKKGQKTCIDLRANLISTKWMWVIISTCKSWPNRGASTNSVSIYLKSQFKAYTFTSASFLMYFPSMLVLAFISCSWSLRWAIISFLCCILMKEKKLVLILKLYLNLPTKCSRKETFMEQELKESVLSLTWISLSFSFFTSPNCLWRVLTSLRLSSSL